MSDITYHQATVADIDSLIALRVDFLAEAVGAGPPDPAWLTALRNFLNTTLPAGTLVVYLARAGAEHVGVGWLLYQQTVPSPASLSGRDAYVMNIYTLPAWRRRGVAAAIVGKLVDCARQTDCRRVALHALPHARTIYTRAGFHQVAEEGMTEMRLALRHNPQRR